nr:immunoglobulin heavy chain junction region [Macaca mulatta]
CARDLPSDYW